MNIDRVEKNKFILFLEIFICIILLVFIYFIFTNKEEKIKKDEKLDINFLSQIGTELIDDVDYINVYTCLEKYDYYFTKCKKGSIKKIDDINEISKIIDKIDDINSMDVVEILPSNIDLNDLRGRTIIDIYYKDKYTSQLIFLDNYLHYTRNKSYGISKVYYDYGTNTANNYVKTIK